MPKFSLSGQQAEGSDRLIPHVSIQRHWLLQSSKLLADSL
jgi:hypothetical protein